MTPYSIPFPVKSQNNSRTFSTSHCTDYNIVKHHQRDAWSMSDCYYSSAGYLPVTYYSSPALLQSEWVNGLYVVSTSKFLGGRHWTRTQEKCASQ